jgi:hypothetical protein
MMTTARGFPALRVAVLSIAVTVTSYAQQPDGRIAPNPPQNAAEQQRELENYKLTVDDLRNFLQVGRNLKQVRRAHPELEAHTYVDPQNLDKWVATVDANPVLLKAVTDAGLTTHQYSTMVMVVMLTSMASMNSDPALALKFMKDAHLHPANLEFVKAHEQELEADTEEVPAAPTLQQQRPAGTSRGASSSPPPQGTLPTLSPEAAAALDELSPRYASEVGLIQAWFRDRTVLYYDFGNVKPGIAAGRVLWPIHGFDARGNPVAIRGQRPIFSTLPGLEDYSGVWRLTYVITADKVQPNELRDAASVEAAVRARKASLRLTDVTLNLPIVPRGTTLARDTTRGMAGWYEGRDIQFFDFGSVHLAPVPMWRFARGMDPSGAPNILSDQNSIVDSIPVAAGYPDLWEISVVNVDTAYVPNSIKSAMALRGTKLSIGPPSTIRNLPIVIIDGSPFRRDPSPLRTFADLRSPFPPKPTRP